MKLFKDMPIGEWFVIGSNSYNEYATYRLSPTEHIEYRIDLGNPTIYERNNTNALELTWEVVDWFENPKVTGNCNCSIPQLMGSGCMCGSISRYKS